MGTTYTLKYLNYKILKYYFHKLIILIDPEWHVMR